MELHVKGIPAVAADWSLKAAAAVAAEDLVNIVATRASQQVGLD